MRLFASDQVNELRSPRNESDRVTSEFFLVKNDDDNAPDLDIEDTALLTNLKIHQPVDSLEAIFEALLIGGNIEEAMRMREEIAREEARPKVYICGRQPPDIPFTEMSEVEYAEAWGYTHHSTEDIVAQIREDERNIFDDTEITPDLYNPHIDEAYHYSWTGGYQFDTGAFVYTHRGPQSFFDKWTPQKENQWSEDGLGESIQQELEAAHEKKVHSQLTSWWQRKEQRRSTFRGVRRIRVGFKSSEIIKPKVDELDFGAWLNDRRVIRQGKRLYWARPEFRYRKDWSRPRTKEAGHTVYGVVEEALTWGERREIRLQGVAVITWGEPCGRLAYSGGYRQAEEFSKADWAMWRQLTPNQRRHALGKEDLWYLDWSKQVNAREVRFHTHSQSWKNQKGAARQWDTPGGRHKQHRRLETERREFLEEEEIEWSLMFIDKKDVKAVAGCLAREGFIPLELRQRLVNEYGDGGIIEILVHLGINEDDAYEMETSHYASVGNWSIEVAA